MATGVSQFVGVNVGGYPSASPSGNKAQSDQPAKGKRSDEIIEELNKSYIFMSVLATRLEGAMGRLTGKDFDQGKPGEKSIPSGTEAALWAITTDAGVVRDRLKEIADELDAFV